MKLVINIIGIALLCSSMAASAYLCPAVDEVKCIKGECKAEDSNSGTWRGTSSAPVDKFYQVVSSGLKIQCYYWNKKGESFFMVNPKLNSYVLQTGAGPWQYGQGTSVCNKINVCEFVID